MYFPRISIPSQKFTKFESELCYEEEKQGGQLRLGKKGIGRPEQDKQMKKKMQPTVLPKTQFGKRCHFGFKLNIVKVNTFLILSSFKLLFSIITQRGNWEKGVNDYREKSTFLSGILLLLLFSAISPLSLAVLLLFLSLCCCVSPLPGILLPLLFLLLFCSPSLCFFSLLLVYLFLFYILFFTCKSAL